MKQSTKRNELKLPKKLKPSQLFCSSQVNHNLVLELRYVKEVEHIKQIQRFERLSAFTRVRKLCIFVGSFWRVLLPTGCAWQQHAQKHLQKAQFVHRWSKHT